MGSPVDVAQVAEAHRKEGWITQRLVVAVVDGPEELLNDLLLTVLLGSESGIPNYVVSSDLLEDQNLVKPVVVKQNRFVGGDIGIDLDRVDVATDKLGFVDKA